MVHSNAEITFFFAMRAKCHKPARPNELIIKICPLTLHNYTSGRFQPEVLDFHLLDALSAVGLFHEVETEEL